MKIKDLVIPIVCLFSNVVHGQNLQSIHPYQRTYKRCTHNMHDQDLHATQYYYRKCKWCTSGVHGQKLQTDQHISSKPSNDIKDVHSQDLQTTQSWIKTGFDLMKAGEYDESEKYLLKGLSAAKNINNRYWEAIANEYLGLLYVKNAQRYFDGALSISQSLQMPLMEERHTGTVHDNNVTIDTAWHEYAGIEVGAKGVKYSIIRAKPQANGRIKYIYNKDSTVNTQVIDFTPTAILNTANAVRNFYHAIAGLNKDIPANHIFICISSGVTQEADKRPGARESLLLAIKDAVPTYRKEIEFLSICKESELNIFSTIPEEYRYKIPLIDIGSGNTKGGVAVEGQDMECINIPWGTVTLAKKINGNVKSRFYSDSVLPVIRREMRGKPGIAKNSMSYYVGGIYWAMCNYLYPQKIKDTLCEFTKKDIEKLLQLASTDSGKLINPPNLSLIKNNELLQEARKQINKSLGQFNMNQIIAGGLLMKGIMDEMERNTSHKKGQRYFFYRGGQTAWIKGYVIKSIKEEYSKTKS